MTHNDAIRLFVKTPYSGLGALGGFVRARLIALRYVESPLNAGYPPTSPDATLAPHGGGTRLQLPRGRA